MIRIFHHYVPTSYLALLLVEGGIFFISIYVGSILRFSAIDSEIDSLGPLWPRAIIYFVLLTCTMTAMGMYDRHSRNSMSSMILRIVIAFFLGFILISLFFYIFPVLYIGRGVLLIAVLVSFISIITGRVIFTKYLDLKHINQRILVLGAGQKAAALEKLLRRKADRRGIELVAYVALSGELVVSDSKVLKYDISLKDIVTQNNIDEIVLAVDDRRNSFPLDEIVDCRMGGVMVSDFVTFIERRACKILVTDLDPSWLMHSDGFGYGLLNDVVTRVFDIVVSSILLIVFSPVLLIAILAMFFEDRCRGGVFYHQVRVGLNGQVYTIYKLRSMCADAESSGEARWASEGDDRVTKVGAILRKLRIDEVPQLFNVIKGNMSLVGPRPERPEFVEDLKKEVAYFSERHRVKPGITGWAQICYPYGASTEDSKAKLEYDLYYVKNRNLFLDLVILFQTVQVILFGKGAR